MSMQEAEEQDTCRICSAPAEPDQPLFHPCKCSGTIRYIHQDCLTTWLAHSKKKNCDVCKHPYAFTKVYAPDMPSSLPPLLLIKRLLQQLFWALLFVLRAVAVTAIWLGVLPWVTVWTWRMYFSMGESTAWWISDRPRPPSSEPPLPFYSKILASSSLLSSLSASTPTSPATSLSSPTSIPTHTPPIPVPTGFLAKISTHPLWLALSADIFAGQIIASLIVLVFVAIFLLREWISQNARPGVFEEEDAPAPAPVAPGPVAAPALGAAAGAALQGQMVGLLAAQNDADFNARLDALIRDAAAAAGGVGPGGEIGPPPPEVRARLEHVLGAERAEEVIRDFMARQAAAGAPGNGGNNRRNNNAVVLDPEIAADPDRWSTTDDDHGSPAGAKRPRVKRKKLHRERERIRRARRQHRVGRAGAEYGIVVPGEASEDEDDQAESGEGSASGQGALGFAFPPHRDALSPSASGPSTSMSASTSVSSALAHSPPQSSVSSPPPSEESEERAREGEADDPAASETTLNPADLTSTSIFPTVSLQPPNGSIPFSLRSVNTSSSNLASSSTPTSYSATLPHSPPPYSASSSSPYPARPPLPSAGLPLPKSGSGSPFLHSASPVPGRTPAESPSVSVTYRAPEELGRDGEDTGEGSSSGFVLPPPGYFDRKNESGKRKRDADDGAHDADSETEEDEETLLEGYSYDEDVDMDVDMDVDADNEDQDGDQQRPGQELEQEQLFDSDVDMEAERRRYFREEGVGADDANLPGLARVPSSSDSSSSEDEDAEEEEDDDLHHHHDHHDDAHQDLLEEENDDEEEFDEDEDLEGQWEVAEVDPAAAAAAIAAGQAAGAQLQPQGPNALNAAAARARNRANALGNLNANGNGNANGGPNGNGLLDQDAAAAAALAAEELDGNVEDDMEGAMEAIGMRGPIYGVLQNAALMIFVLDTAIGLGVWIPFTIGKTTALLSLDPHRMLQVLHLPIRAMRVVTDPFVDFIQWILVDLVLPWVLRLLGLVLKLVVFVGSVSAGKVLGEETREGVVQFGMKLYNQSVDL
ncbi:hypothetical protein CVT26_002833, partial [Gymnopilus dilepis]